MSELVFIGSYTEKLPWVDGKGKGISIFRFNPHDGSLTPTNVFPNMDNPTYLCLHPTKKFLYAITETYGKERLSSVLALGIDQTNGSLVLLNKQSTHGEGGCHLMTDKHGKFLLAANYGDGSIASFKINSDGSLSEAVDVQRHAGNSVNKQRQEGPHCHCTIVDLESNKYLFVADLGLDKVVVYEIHPSTGKLNKLADEGQVSVPPGSGPRQFVFHPTSKFAYLINELHSNVCAYSYDPHTGKLAYLQLISTLPEHYSGQSTCAAIRVSPDGKTLYGSNRGHDSLAGFAIDQTNGTLKSTCHTLTKGKTPRDFAFHPSGSYLIAANQDSSTLVTFKVDKDGNLSDTGKIVDCGSPVCVLFLGPTLC